MCHNTGSNTDNLRKSLLVAFDRVVVVDSGSNEDKKASPGKDVFYRENLYWTGCWNFATDFFNDGVDVIWVIGGDVSLLDDPVAYKEAIESAMPFGCWSPSIKGCCRSLMDESNTRGRVCNVWNVEGIAMAISKKAYSQMEKLPDDNKLGWGFDTLMSWMAWNSGQRNIIDGRVVLYHPSERGYNKDHAYFDMVFFFHVRYGDDWHDLFRCKSDKFDYNFIKEIVI
jgi:hypothetical protein